MNSPDTESITVAEGANHLESRIRDCIDACVSAIVAFSGGVDSSLLLKLALEQLGPERLLAVTAASPLLSPAEIKNAREIAIHIGAPHLIVSSGELEVEAIIANQPDRCYHCKHHKLRLLCAQAAKSGFHSVLEGSNLSDTVDYRPGLSALNDFKMVCSPYLACGITKQDIRLLARRKGLPNWNTPAAACLASRIPYGSRIDQGKLSGIARAEAGLRALGLDPVRVRHHGEIARIEADPRQFALMAGETTRHQISSLLKACGFLYAALDLEGYRTGSLNQSLGLNEPAGGH